MKKTTKSKAVLFLFVLFAFRLFSQVASEQADKFLQSTLLREALEEANWEAALNGIPLDSTVLMDPRIMLLRGHVYYALQAYNFAATAFHLTDDSTALANWASWTGQMHLKAPSNAVFQFLAADGLARTHRYPEALKLLDKAVNDKRIAHLAFIAKGVIYDILNQESATEENFNLAKNAMPDFLDSKLCLNYGWMISWSCCAQPTCPTQKTPGFHWSRMAIIRTNWLRNTLGK